MNNDIELINKYDDISTSNKPIIPHYHGDMFIDVEQEYLMRKDLQQRIDKAIKYIENNQLYEDLTEYDDEINFSYVDDLKASKELLSILRGEK